MANVRLLPLVLVIVIAAGGNAGIVMMAEAQSAPPAGSSCSSFLVSLAPCLAFMQPGVQNNTTPTQGCCTALASVVNTSAACLCQLLTTTNNSLGIPINQTRSLALPGACKITTPPVSQCKSPAASSPPAAAPSSPVSSPPVAAPSSPVSSPTAAAPSSATPVISNPTPTAKSPATSAILPPNTSPTTGGAVSPSTKDGPTASANAGWMMDVSMLIHFMGIVGSLMYII